MSWSLESRVYILDDVITWKIPLLLFEIDPVIIKFGRNRRKEFN